MKSRSWMRGALSDGLMLAAIGGVLVWTAAYEIVPVLQPTLAASATRAAGATHVSGLLATAASLMPVTESPPPGLDLVSVLEHNGLVDTDVDVRVRLCLDNAGVPESAEILDSSGVVDVDAQIKEETLAWRYQPLRVNGEPFASCTEVSFHYRLDSQS